MTNPRVRKTMRQTVSLACVLFLLPAGAILMAQQPAPPAGVAAPAPPAPPAAQLLSPEQLGTLVAPIALYPDALLSQVLVASTYPLEVVEAAQWLQQNRSLSGPQLVDAARQQNWDASIQALVAFPDVLARLNSDIRWTTDLGNAFLAQQADVMNAVQQMRVRARAAGKLNSNAQQTVTTQTQGDQTAIDIAPANPEVVYVPVYDPEYIWGPPLWGYYPPLYYPAFGFGFGFGPGIYIGSYFGGLGWGGWGWGPNWFNCTIFTNPFFFNRYHFGGYYGGGYRGGVWAHNPEHRQGVPYANARVAGRFGGGFQGNHGVAGRPNINGNFANRGNAGGNSFATQRAGAQAGGWRQFGQAGVSRSPVTTRSAPSYNGNGNSGAAGRSPANRFGTSQPAYRSSPSSLNYRAAPSYGGSSAGRVAPSYRSSPSYGGGYRAAPSYSGGYRSAPSYSGRSFSGGGGGFRSGGGGGGFHGGGGGGSHGGGRR